MSFTLDSRIPVILATPDRAGPEDAILVEGDDFTPAELADHPPACLCCAPRTNAGRALGLLLQARARGTVPFFRRVVASASTPAGRADIEAALASDPIASSCYRLI